ncbi:DNA-3-methyladenine glycosylase 2 family protein [Streptomonospora sp. PA3]|uniref:DNA-3-methyladenine glycosylase 2 family protein n=1 Tax=Streptomonospora sp. PA3 TaxID=2607326 RepID=UPI0012DD4540|nr:DNA-3-methyladenine glycosylase 2 family protein [Streptomonospora sp. PA3]MUL40302.1 DNA-3-methyladenine glycosylase 2 family protein [Streptomonospora sp. PA3]
MDDDQRYLAVRSQDARFDGVFYVGVTSTGIYCRPSCPALTPKRENTRFFPSAAAAQRAGFRACKRCRPDASPGSPEWNVRADIVGRSMRLISDGAVDREGVAGLAARVGYSERQLNRLLVTELGAGPLALARAQRAQTARVLIETTGLPMGDIAFAAGFSSIRQFNDTVREVFGRTPSQLRRIRAGRVRRPGDAHAGPASASDTDGPQPGPAETGTVTLRLPLRPPIDIDHLFDFLAARAVPGVEEVAGGVYRRVLNLPHGSGTVHISRGEADDHVWCRLCLDLLKDLGTAVQRCRRLLDLDTDPHAVAEVLGADGSPLAALVAQRPGLRVPGHADPAESATRAVVGQQISISAARTVAGRLVERFGTPLAFPAGGLTHTFPRPDVLAGLAPEDLPMPAGRAGALIALSDALAAGKIDLGPGADRDEATARLRELPGIGPWTSDYIRIRALGDPDVFLSTDLGVRRALERLGHAGDPRSAERTAQAWRPWRSYATHHLWASATSPPSAGQATAEQRNHEDGNDDSRSEHDAGRTAPGTGRAGRTARSGGVRRAPQRNAAV